VGMLFGTFLGAAIAANSNSAAAAAPATGAGAIPPGKRGVGMTPGDAQLSRYDGRYQKAGVEPPHKCTIASSTRIAQQLDPRWTYQGFEGCFPSDPRPSMQEGEAQVTTPTGSKTIPIWTDNRLPDGGYNRGRMPTRLVLQCPYTGTLFQFFRT